MLSAKKAGWLAICAALIAVLLVSSFPFVGVPLGSKSSGNLISIVSAQDDPCAGCDTVLDEIQLWQNRLDTLPSDADAVRAQQALDAANNRLNRCITHGCDIGEPTPTPTPTLGSEEEPDPCLRGYETCVHVWEGNDKCLKECLERYNACKPAYEEYKILDEKYAKCLECIIRCDSVMPEKMVFGGLTAEEYIEECRENYKACKPTCKGDSECLKKCEKQYDDCIKAYDEYIAVKAECDADYQSFCEGDAEILLQKVIAANNKYIPLSTDLTCTAITPTSNLTVQEIPLSLTANFDGVVADGISSVNITVTLPSTSTQTVTLTDGKTTLTETAVNGEAVFTYVPDTEKLGLSPSNIPPEGADMTLTAETADGKSGKITLKIYRRPVLLVHGLFSSADMWGQMKVWLESDGFKVYCVDYKQENAGDITIIAEKYVKTEITKLIKEFLNDGINVTKIDVMAHSMGGVVMEYYIAHDENKGNDIHTLIMIGTPHEGSPLPTVYEKYKDKSWAKPLLKQLGAHPGKGLKQLKTDSNFLKTLKSTVLNKNVNYYNIIGTNNALAGMVKAGCPADVDLHFDKGDGVVPLASQRGRYAEAKNYYVYAPHVSAFGVAGEGSNRDTFEVASRLLKGLDQRPFFKDESIKKLHYQKGTSLKVVQFERNKDQATKKYRSEAYILIPDFWGNPTKPKEPYKDQKYLELPNFPNIIELGLKKNIKQQNGDYIRLILGILDKNKKQIGKLGVYMTYKDKMKQYGPRVRIYTPTTYQIYEGSNVYIKHDGFIYIYMHNAIISSPDPELLVSVDENGLTEVVLLDGEITVSNIDGDSMMLYPGQTMSIKPNGTLENPATTDVSLIERWWKEPGHMIQVRDHVLCKNVDSDGNPIDMTSTFNAGDLVFSRLGITNASVGDEVWWFSQGPNYLADDVMLTLNYSGEGYCYASLDLSEFDSEQMVGSWNITVYINGEMASIAYFDVERASTDTPGFEIALLIGAIVVALIVIKRRKHTL